MSKRKHVSEDKIKTENKKKPTRRSKPKVSPEEKQRHDDIAKVERALQETYDNTRKGLRDIPDTERNSIISTAKKLKELKEMLDFVRSL